MNIPGNIPQRPIILLIIRLFERHTQSLIKIIILALQCILLFVHLRGNFPRVGNDGSLQLFELFELVEGDGLGWKDSLDFYFASLSLAEI